MAFSEFLNSRRDDCKALIAELSAQFPYVSILGNHVRSSRIGADRRSSVMGEGNLSECGFVIKMQTAELFSSIISTTLRETKRRLPLKLSHLCA